MKKFSELINENENIAKLPDDVKTISFDHRDFSDDTAKTLKAALKTFGINMYNSSGNSDMFIYFLTKSTLDKKQIKKLSEY